MNEALFFNASQMSNLAILSGYMAILVVLGAIISLKTTTPSSFMLGSRSFPGWLLAFSIVGTNISSLAFLAFPTKGYNLDFEVIAALCLADGLALLLAGLFFVRFLRKTPDASIYTLLERRFGVWASVFASVTFILSSLFRMGVIMCLVAKAIHMISGSNVGGVILLCGIIVIFYTYMAGIEGVIWTDLIQTIFLIVAGVAALLFVGNMLPEGLRSVGEVLPWNTDSMLVGTVTVPLWIACIHFFVGQGGFFMTNQAIAQRYLAGNSLRSAKRSTYIAAIVSPLTVCIFFLIGVALYILYNKSGVASLPLEIATDADKVFIYFLTQSVPDGLKGLMIVGILSAAMSTVDSGINSGATVFISNIYHPHIKRGRGDSSPSMDVLRRVSLLFGTLGIGIGYLVFISGENVLDVFWKWAPVLNMGIFGLFILVRISRRVGAISAVISIIVGSTVTAWISFTAGKDFSFAAPFHYMLNGPIGLSVMVITGLVCSRVFKPRECCEREVVSTTYDEATGEDRVERPVNTEYHLIKQNALINALQPNPYYRLLGLAGVIFYALMLSDAFSIALVYQDRVLMGIGAFASLLLAVTPVDKSDSHNKLHSIFVLSLMGVAFPFVGAIGFFAHPEDIFFNYFFMATVAVLGAFTEWVVLGFLVSVSACLATMLVSHFYVNIGVPGNWLALTSGCLGIMTLYAMSSARRSFREREKLEGISMIARTMLRENTEGRSPLNRLIADTADLLESGTLDEESYPRETISVEECLLDAVDRYPFKEHQRCAVELKLGGDFSVEGSYALLVNCFLHLIDNAAYYVGQGQANAIVCRIDADKRQVHIEDDGPGIPARNVPYIFELFFSAGKLGSGMGLTYCRKALKLMGGSIHLTSNSGDAITRFTLSFPEQD